MSGSATHQSGCGSKGWQIVVGILGLSLICGLSSLWILALPWGKDSLTRSHPPAMAGQVSGAEEVLPASPELGR
jgi:hypothetical protein